jgi:membrane-bound ClpP family serine protease
MSPLGWAILLFAFGMALIVVELFVPSGGVIGFISAASVVTSIVMAFRYSEYTGLGFMAAAVLGTPALLAVLFKWWPQTPFGRRVLLDAPRGEDMLPTDELRREIKRLVGRVGTAKSLMLPGGPIVVDGHTFDAVSEGMVVQPGQAVRVVDVRGTRIVVRPITDDEAAAAAIDPNDPLNQSIDVLGLGPLDEPLK